MKAIEREMPQVNVEDDLGCETITYNTRLTDLKHTSIFYLKKKIRKREIQITCLSKMRS